MGGWVYFMNQLWKKRVMLLFWDGWIDFQVVTVVGTGQHTIGRPGQLTRDKQGTRWMKIFLVLAQCRFFYEWCLNCMSNDVCLQLCSNSKWMVKKSTPLHPLLHCPILQNVLITLSKRKKQEITSWCLNQPIWKYGVWNRHLDNDIDMKNSRLTIGTSAALSTINSMTFSRHRGRHVRWGEVPIAKGCMSPNSPLPNYLQVKICVDTKRIQKVG